VSGLRALFVCDGSPAVGGGHVMRSLTLARALGARGWRSTFLADPFVDGLLDRFDPIGCDRIPVENQWPETLAVAAQADGFDAVVFDHFHMAFEHETHVSRPDVLSAVIDDLANRPHAADLLVDCNLQRTAADYAELAPEAELLLGPAYAPVRPEFAVQRERALGRRQQTPAEPGRILISLGLTDLDGITEQVVGALPPSWISAGLDVVIARGAPSWPALERLASRGAPITLHSHLDAAAMAELMVECDMAVGAGGSSTWERATLGLGTITVILADNQMPGARALERFGATVAVDLREPHAMETLVEVLRREALDAFWAMGRKAADLCDGLGARRTADRLTARVQSGGRQ